MSKTTKVNKVAKIAKIAKICRAKGCNLKISCKRHPFCRKHYHEKHLEGLSNEAKTANNKELERFTIDTLEKKCKAIGCSQIVFREHHDLCRTHYHELRLNQCK